MTDEVQKPALAVRLQQPVRPADPERVAFEAWLNPGNHAGNVSPWVEEPGRYQQDTHQLAWLAWRAGRKQERERWQAHADAMAKVLEAFEAQGSDKTAALRAYRAFRA